MDNNRHVQSNGSHIWPYLIVGSAIGGAVGYLLYTDSARKFRRTVTHPDELADSLEDAGHFIERKARFLNDKVHDVINKAKFAIEEGELAYREAERKYQSQARLIENKNEEIASSVHKTVDNISRTAGTVEKSVLDPICDLAALYRGLESGIRAALGQNERPMRVVRGVSSFGPSTEKSS